MTPPHAVDANRRHGPQFQVTLMKGVGHYLMLEDPERFANLLLQTLRRMLR